MHPSTSRTRVHDSKGTDRRTAGKLHVCEHQKEEYSYRRGSMCSIFRVRSTGIVVVRTLLRRFTPSVDTGIHEPRRRRSVDSTETFLYRPGPCNTDSRKHLYRSRSEQILRLRLHENKRSVATAMTLEKSHEPGLSCAAPAAAKAQMLTV
eukprot:3708497-Pleurochrysis_carterae.AAC.1